MPCYIVHVSRPWTARDGTRPCWLICIWSFHWNDICVMWCKFKVRNHQLMWFTRTLLTEIMLLSLLMFFLIGWKPWNTVVGYYVKLYKSSNWSEAVKIWQSLVTAWYDGCRVWIEGTIVAILVISSRTPGILCSCLQVTASLHCKFTTSCFHFKRHFTGNKS